MQIISAPDASEIEGQSKVRFEKVLIDHALESDEYHSWANEIMKREDARDMVAGLLAKAYGDQPRGYSIRADIEAEMSRDKNRRDTAPPYPSRGRLGQTSGGRPQRASMEGGVQLQIEGGRDNGWEVGPLLGAICRSMGVNREDVGNIRLREGSATVELSARAAEMLESRKARMTKEGIQITAMKALTRPASAEQRPYARSRDRVPRPERMDRGERSVRSRRSDSDRPRGRRYS
jgi:ATP-dependent RNA helicase DeaD